MSGSVFYNNIANFVEERSDSCDSDRCKGCCFLSLSSMLVGMFMVFLGALTNFDKLEQDLLVGFIVLLVVQPIYMLYLFYIEYHEEDPEDVYVKPMTLIGLVLLPLFSAIGTSLSVDWVETW